MVRFSETGDGRGVATKVRSNQVTLTQQVRQRSQFIITFTSVQ